MTNRQIAQKLSRTYMGVFRMTAKLGLNGNPEKMKLRPEGMAPFFTEKEKEFIRNNYLKMTNAQIAEKLKRSSIDGIRKYAKKLGLAGSIEKKNLAHGPLRKRAAFEYTDKEKEFIRKYYLKLTSEQIGKKLNRSKYSIDRMIGLLGLSGNPKRLSHSNRR